MEYREIRENTSYDDGSTTVIFKCNPPVQFEPYSADDPVLPGSKGIFLLFGHVTVCAFKPSESIPYGRTVIHATSKLQGGDGFCYGALADPLVMDGHADAWAAIEALGYTLAKEDAEAA